VYLPHSFRIESPRSYVKTEPFWGHWTGTLSSHGWVLLGLNIGLIALGIGSSWRKKTVLALAPLLVGIGYNASVSIGRLSGWRFIQPADWITLIYFSIGLMQLSAILHFVLFRQPQGVEKEVEPGAQTFDGLRGWSPVVGSVLVFALVGLTLTYGHGLFSSRYPPKPAGQLLEEYRAQTDTISAPPSERDVAGFLQTKDAVILYGEALYPAFFKADAGVFNHYLLSYESRPYRRVVFHLAGPQSAGVILPIRAIPTSFPDGAQVIVLGCKTETGVVQALSVLITGEKPILYNRNPASDLVCPLPE
jgi:hypothetical protein